MSVVQPDNLEGSAIAPLTSTLAATIADSSHSFAIASTPTMGYRRILGGIKADAAVVVRILQGLVEGGDPDDDADWLICDTFTAAKAYAPEGTGGSYYSVGWSPELACRRVRIDVTNDTGGLATIVGFEASLTGAT